MIRVRQNKILKKKIMEMKNVLHVEFDFGLNLGCSKLSVNSQFYCRLLWLSIFNVHVYIIHNNSNSYMFHFIEVMLKKGANTVCNLVYHVIFEQLKSESYNEIYLCSNAAGGDNRNYLMVIFLSMLSIKFQNKIQNFYPVRGHSYCQCDRNFGKYGNVTKMHKVIETDQDYVNSVENSRDPSFTMVDVYKCKWKILNLMLKTTQAYIFLWQKIEINVMRSKKWL